MASRDRFLSGGAVVGLGGKLHQITVDHLRLNHTELSIYSHLCGTQLNDRQDRITSSFQREAGFRCLPGYVPSQEQGRAAG